MGTDVDALVPDSRDPDQRRAVRPLHNGDKLPQAEFHRRYVSAPEHVRVELIGGIVYMSSPQPVSHGAAQAELGTLLTLYKAGTPGVEVASGATVILDARNEIQPDLLARILPRCGGRSRTTDRGFIQGPPELIAEVAHDAAAIDLHAKKDAYQQAGVLEYLVFCDEEADVRWFDLQAGIAIEADGEGIFKSMALPGLWLDAGALAERHTSRLVKLLGSGLKTKGHDEFAQLLKRRGPS